MLLENKHIFVVEDNIINRTVIKTILENEGAKVVVDQWRDNSLRPLVSYPHRFDLVLLDLVLPGEENGYDVGRRIRQYDHLADVPIVIVSGSDPVKEIPKIRANRFDGFVPKPIDETLPSLLLSILNGEVAW